MKKILATALLFSLAAALAGCKTAQQTQPTQPNSRNDSASRNEQYNRGYESESHHHRHHRDRGESEADTAANDGWSTYDRRDEDDGAANNRTESARNDSADNAGQARSSRHHNSRALSAAPGQFDFYVLNLSWSPEFCHSHASAAECAQHRAFTLHGLWPENNNGTYPEDCSDAAGPANPSQYADIYPDPSLLQHEWQTHGTCSGLGPDQFFTTARRADQSIQVPTRLTHLTQQITLTPAQVVTLFTQSNPGLSASSIAISCGNNFLTAVEVCVDKNLKAQSCSALKTCRASQVRIAAPE